MIIAVDQHHRLIGGDELCGVPEIVLDAYRLILNKDATIRYAAFGQNTAYDRCFCAARIIGVVPGENVVI